MYIGKKDFTSDRIFGTGACWNGNGDVVDIPDATAQLMVRRFPEVYAEAGTAVAGVVEEKAVPAGGGGGRGPVSIDPLDTIFVQDGEDRVSLRNATRAALMRHAKGMAYQPRNTATKVNLIEEIVRLTALEAEAEGAGAPDPVDPDQEE